MGLPGTFVGNAGELAFANIKRVADEFIDAVEQMVRERGIARGFVRILRPANFHILLDVKSIHIVYTNTSAGAIPAINITDLTQRNMLAPITGGQAILIVERDLGYRDCEAITISRELIDKSKEEVSVAMIEEAQDYVNAMITDEQQRIADQEARSLLALPSDTGQTGLLEGIKKAHADVPYATSVFVMMRYGEGQHHAAIEHVIVSTLISYGLTARLAKNKSYSDDLWENVRIYMHACNYGIAVFEEIDERKFNPNVAMELGYMYALRRRVLLLKDKRMPIMPTDIVGRIYRQFDTYAIEESIEQQIKAWAENDLQLKRQ